MKRRVVPGTKGKSRRTGNLRAPCSCWLCTYRDPKFYERLDWLNDEWDY